MIEQLKLRLPYVAIIILLAACSPNTAKKHRYPNPVDTSTRPIDYQVKKIFTVGDVSASNDFPAARLNNFVQVNDSTYLATISPENIPINESPWYAFKIWSETARSVYVTLQYTEHTHRYDPKVSRDGENWSRLDSLRFTVSADTTKATMQLDIGTDPIWVAAQEIQDHKRVGEWVAGFKENDFVTVGEAGVSVQGRSMYYMNISDGAYENKPTIVIMSRQHPPEVTGYLAMKAFVETLISEGGKNGFLKKYRVMIYPLMNPDGVDLGHYRHNTGGIDQNRDWARYNQPETSQVANHIVSETNMNNNEIVLGLDFHSTYRDVYYTFDESVKNRTIPGFTSEWLLRIKKGLNLDDINEQPGGIRAPTSQGWFYKQFGAEHITYEIGDETPRDFIRVKGEVSAKAMMDILLEMK